MILQTKLEALWKALILDSQITEGFDQMKILLILAYLYEN